jgi:hypothetical protein
MGRAASAGQARGSQGNVGLEPVFPADMLFAAHVQRSKTPLGTQTGSLCSVRCFLPRDEFVDQRIGRFFQKHAPRAEHSQCCDGDQ